MPKSWMGSRYTGYSCTSSRFRKVASEVTGPGVTTWRLVRMRPRSASTTKPVACAEEFHSVSKARVWSISMATTLSATRASVPRQAALSPSLCGMAACVAADCAPTCCCADCGAGPCAMAGVTNNRPSSRMRRSDMLSPMLCPRKIVRPRSAPEHQHPDHGEQCQRREHGCRTDVLREPRERVALEADAIDRGLDGTVEELHDQHDEHGRDQQDALDAVLAEPQAQGDDHHR